MPTPDRRHHLEHAGRELTVAAEREGLLSTAVVAYADDEELGREVQDGLAPVRIPVDAEWTIEADSTIPGRLSRCELRAGDDLAVPFDPPAGTRAARLAARRDAHPRLWAARHVAIAVGQMLVAAVGFGLVLRGLLPAIDLPDVDLPDVDLPLPDLFGWVPDIDLPDLPDLPDLYARYWLPVLIAVGIAVHEVRKRGRSREAQRRASGEPPAGDDA